MILKKLKIKRKEFELWQQNIKQSISDKLGEMEKIDDQCLLLEMLGTFYFHSGILLPRTERLQLSLDTYRRIIPLLPGTTSYSMSTLSEKINQFIEMGIKYKFGDEEVDLLESFVEEIEEHATKTTEQHRLAKELVRKATSYVLDHPSQQNLLKGLDHYHRAKKLWYLDDTAEGYVLSLVNIAQVYQGLGMSLAAKKYALAAGLATTEFGGPKALNRLSDAYIMVLQSDYRQGAWISAIDSFGKYLYTRLEFKAVQPTLGNDEMYRSVLMEMAFIFFASEQLDPAMSDLIDQVLQFSNPVERDWIVIFMESLTQEIKNNMELVALIRQKINGVPLNDVGRHREIRFNALGIDWEISFENNANLNAIGEGFCAILQIILCQVVASGSNLKIEKKTIQIEIFENQSSELYPKPRFGTNQKITVNLPSGHDTDKAKLQSHDSYVGQCVIDILQSVSLLPLTDFEKIVENWFEKGGLSDKIFAGNTYEQLYFELFTLDEFDRWGRRDFQQVPLPEQFYLTPLCLQQNHFKT